MAEENKEEESSGEISSWTGRTDGPLLPPPPLIDRANIKDKGQPAATAAAPLQQLNNSRTAMAAAATAPPPPRRLSSTEQKSGIDYFMTLKRSPVPSLSPRHVISLAVQKAQILRADKVKFHDPERAPVLTVSREAMSRLVLLFLLHLPSRSPPSDSPEDIDTST